MNRDWTVRGFKTFRLVVSVCVILLSVVITSATAVAQAASPILAKDAKWQEVSRAGKIWAEGVVAAKDGTIYLTDLTRSRVIKENNPRGTIYRYDPTTGATTKYMEPSGMANGLHVDKNGDLIIAQDADFGGRAVLRRNLATGKTVVLADSYEGKKLNAANDVTSDAQGRIYFTDARYGGDEPILLPNAVYRIDPDGKVTRIAMDTFRPNGIEVSADGKCLYVAACNSTMLPINPNGPAKDKFGMVNGGIVVYDLDKAGNVSNGREFYRSSDDLGADGTAMDTDGNLYVALHSGNPKAPKADIVVISPAGVVLQHLPVPPGNGLTTNLAFGRGADSHSLYVTTSFPWGLYRIQTVKTGFYE